MIGPVRSGSATLALSTVGVALLVAAVACGPTPEGDETVSEEAERVTAFCTGFPERRAAVAFEVLDDPTVGGDPTVAATLMDWVADSAEQHAPDELRGPVARYAEALRSADGTVPPLDDGELADAVSAIDAWLATHCGPPTGSVPVTGR